MWGKGRKSKTTRAWGYRSTLNKGPSKQRTITSKRWVAKVPRWTTGVLWLQGGET